MKVDELVKFAEKCNQFPQSLSLRWEQINKKNLYVSQKLRDRFYLIKSYSTIVGIVDEKGETFLEMGKYSPTTSKQITYIHRNRFYNCERLFTDRKVS